MSFYAHRIRATVDVWLINARVSLSAHDKSIETTIEPDQQAPVSTMDTITVDEMNTASVNQALNCTPTTRYHRYLTVS